MCLTSPRESEKRFKDDSKEKHSSPTSATFSPICITCYKELPRLPHRMNLIFFFKFDVHRLKKKSGISKSLLGETIFYCPKMNQCFLFFFFQLSRIVGPNVIAESWPSISPSLTPSIDVSGVHNISKNFWGFQIVKFRNFGAHISVNWSTKVMKY